MAELVGLTENFGAIRFSRSTLEAFIDEARRVLGVEGNDSSVDLRVVDRGTQRWNLPSTSQFLVEVGHGYDQFQCFESWDERGSVQLRFGGSFEIEVKAPTRAVVEEYAQFVASKVDEGERILVAPTPLRVFIGHGRSTAWVGLKDHLSDIHKIDVEHYEVASRSGFTIREVLDKMLERSTMALLVMTAEDLQGDGSMRARQNVVHEAGLFQGRLGFSRAVVIKESTADLFSNLDGIQYIEFDEGNIRESFGDVVGVIRREFPLR